MVPDIRRQPGELCGGEVRRVRDDEVHGSPQGRRQGRKQVAFDDGHAGGPHQVPVAPGPGCSLGAHLGCPHGGVGALDRDGQGDGPRARADVHHHGRRHAGHPTQRVLHEHLRLGTGHQHARPNGEVQAAERLMAGQVLEGFAPNPAGHEVPEPACRLGGQRLVDPAVELRPAQAQHMGDKDLGFGLRALDGRTQATAGPPQGFARVTRRRAAPHAPSRSGRR